ncbi:prolyl-tRNA synthetase associated domain-containing protein [Candidatus Peregrinibacteria bacterium]|nr:prolyl-tRNA synthetase associated domain-containing protein [Candidatus Peregrinibacteria bacterium]
MNIIQTVEEYLSKHEIAYILHTHPPVFTCEEAEIHCKTVPGIPGKNLFLRDKKGQRFFLVILPAHKKADLKKIGTIVNDKKISFGNAEKLKTKLDLYPGAVSPFGLLNDKNTEVEVYIDREMYEAELVNFHPNDNSASLELTKEMFHKFLSTLPHKIQII